MQPTDNPCDLITGPAKEHCTGEAGPAARSPGETGLPEKLDPLSAFADSCADAAAWTARTVGDLVGDPSLFDPTATGFVRQYAVVFAGSAVLVLLLWLGAVTKRAIRGVPFTQALGEAVGLLWLAVITTAMMPLILYVVVQATSAVTRAISGALGQKPGSMFDALADGLAAGDVGGGPIMLIIASLLVIALCGALGLLLVLRALGLYVGALLGIPVFAGLVDKDLWRHFRRWSGIMAGLIAIEPVLMIIIGLANAVRAEGEIITGMGITAIALAVTISLIVKTPGWGESVRMARTTARGLGGAVNTVVGGGGPASGGVMNGIQAHGSRTPEPRTPNRVNGSSPGGTAGGGLSGGIAADSKRTPKPKKDDDS